MGRRANLVVVNGGRWMLYNDHWCASCLDQELFWGPEYATQYIKRWPPLIDQEGWFDERWCEAAAIVDHDRKILLWYSRDPFFAKDLPTRREFLRLMGRLWPNWEIRFALGGIVEIGAYLGIESIHFTVEEPSAGGCTIWRQRPDPRKNYMLLTVKKNDGHGVTIIPGDRRSLLFGSKGLSQLTTHPTAPLLEWMEQHPTVGLHLDLDEMTMYYWLETPSESIEERVQAVWPEWESHWLRDRFEDHLELSAAEIRLRLHRAIDVQLGIIEKMRGFLQGSEPFQHIDDKASSRDAEEWEKSRCSLHFGHWPLESLSEKWRMLDELKNEVILRLGIF